MPCRHPDEPEVFCIRNSIYPVSLMLCGEGDRMKSDDDGRRLSAEEDQNVIEINSSPYFSICVLPDAF